MSMKRFAHGGDVYAAREDGAAWLDFSANINPLGLPESARQAILAHVDDVVHYPDPAARALSAALSAHAGTPVDTLVLGNGASELFYLFFAALRPRRVLLPVPAFSEYERAALSAGAEVEYFLLRERDGFALDVEKFLAAARDVQADAVVLGNPNNPTGTLTPREALVHLSERLTALGASLVVDESFLAFRADEAHFTLQKDAGHLPHCFVVRSLTKFFAIPGLRLGYGVALPALKRKLDAQKDVWNVNVLAQAAGAAALGDAAYIERTRRETALHARVLEGLLKDLPGVAHVQKPSANFLLVRLEDAAKTDALLAGLKARGILVRDCANFPGLTKGWLRLALRTPEENERLVAAWRAVWAEMEGEA